MSKMILRTMAAGLVCLFVSMTCAAPEARASESLQSLLVQLLKSHEEIKNYQSRVERARADYSQSRGLYFPSLDLTADGGREHIDKEYSSDTTETRYEVKLRAEQLITDFGRTSATIDRSGIALKQAQIQLESTRQQLMLDGITAYINLIKARERLKSARQSEARIKALTGIERTLVQKGAGLSSDVLQAKSQLSGAMATRVDAQGDLMLAKNRFRTIFYRFPTDEEIDGFEDVPFPTTMLPLDLDRAVAAALKENPELLITRLSTRLSDQDIAIAKTAFYPTLNLFAEALRKDNDQGVQGYSNEASGGIELSYNLLNGGIDRAALKSALAGKKAAAFHAGYVEKLIREQVANSWEQLSILSQKNDLLEQQADIVQNFLELAKKERKMGTRSLLDVLNGEINYINAVSTAISARQDTKIAAYNLLFAMGRIKLTLFD